MAVLTKPVKLVYVITSTTVGGAENTLYNLARRVNGAETELCHIICLKPLGPVAQKLINAGFKVTSLNMGYIPSPKHRLRFVKLIEEIKPDIVHAFLFRAIQFARYAKKITPFKLIASPRVNYRTRSKLILAVDKKTKSCDDLVICEADASRAFLIERQKYDASKVKVILNGIDSSLWQYDVSLREKYRFISNLNSGHILIFSDGRLTEQKGFAYLVKAMQIIRAKYSNKVKLMVAGTGEEEGRLLKLTRKLKLDDVIRFIGRQEDIRGWLCAADIFALPSLWEGLPNALMEAMCLGLPCVATDADGVREIAVDNETALFAKPADSKSLAEALGKFIDDKALRELFAKRAKTAIIANNGIDKMIDAYKACYKEVVK